MATTRKPAAAAADDEQPPAPPAQAPPAQDQPPAPPAEAPAPPAEQAQETPPAGPLKVAITTTMRPNDPIEVTPHEAEVLHHQGLLTHTREELAELIDAARARLANLAGKTARPVTGGTAAEGDTNQ